MEIFIQSEDVKIEFDSGTLLICQENKRTPISPERLERLWLHPSTELNGAAMGYLLEHGIELCICTEDGMPIGTLTPWSNPTGARARRRQLYFAVSPEAKRMAAGWIYEKQRAQLNLLHEWASPQTSTKQLDRLQQILTATEQLMGQSAWIHIPDLREAPFARTYFRVLNALLPTEWQFTKRSQHPAQDAFNAALNYGYGIFYGILEGQVKRVGLDPYIGFWHKERDGQPVLVYDLIEPYRPWVERSCLQLALSGSLKVKQDFKAAEGAKGVWLADSGKSTLIHHLFDFMDRQAPGKKQTYRQLMLASVSDLQKIISAFSIES